MRVEALSRLAGEAELRKRHTMEFERLLKSKGDHVAAIAELVTKHGKEYSTLVSESRATLQAQARAKANPAA